LEAEALDRLAEDTVGYCGADLKGLCAEAALNALRRRYPQVTELFTFIYKKIKIQYI